MRTCIAEEWRLVPTFGATMLTDADITATSRTCRPCRNACAWEIASDACACSYHVTPAGERVTFARACSSAHADLILSAHDCAVVY